MEDDDAQTTEPAGATEAENEPGDEGKTFDADYVRSLRQEAAKYRTQAKENADKAAKYDEHVQSQKTEQERVAEQLAAAEAERDRLQSELLRSQVAASKQLPPSLVARLRGTTVEELEADADALMADLKGQFVPRQTTTPDQTGAGVTGDADKGMSPEAYAELLAKRG